VWGAGWTYGGKVFFAHNRGEGVFEVPIDKINLKVKSAAPVVLARIGKSAPSGFNDGANCMKASNPWITKVYAVDCAKHQKPIHARRVPGQKGYDFSKFDMASGTYEGLYFLPFSKTKPAFKYLNAIGVNPLDGISYGCLLFNEFPNTFWIVRFDGKTVEFVTKVVDKYDPIAGTFDSEGNYFVAQNNNYTHNVEMFAFKGLNELKGFASPNAKKLPVKANIPVKKLWNFNHFSDLVTVKHQFNKTGVKEYVMSINRERQAVFVEWNWANASASTFIRYKTNDPFPGKKQNHNFGAAWSYKNRVFFASNDGFGVVEASRIDNKGLSCDKRYGANEKDHWCSGTLTLQNVGKSAAVVNTDGFNCWEHNSPFVGVGGGARTRAFIR